MDCLGRREKFFVLNSLASVSVVLVDKAVLIDMRNETSVAGRISNSDGFMNITLNEVVYIDQKGLQYEFDEFMVPARNIRQIHIPDNIRIENEITKFLNKRTQKKSLVKNQKAGSSFKRRRAEKRHKETLSEIGKL